MSWLSDLIHPGRPYKDAAGTIQQSVQDAQGYQQPYYDAGVGGLSSLQDIIKKLSDPKGFMDELTQGYSESPYATAAKESGKEAGMQTAEQMGLGGSSNELSGITATAENITQRDRDSYIQKLMDMYNQAGQFSQGVAGMGQSAGQSMGQAGMSGARDIAGLDVAGRQAGSDMLGKIIGALGSLGTGGIPIPNLGGDTWMTGNGVI